MPRISVILACYNTERYIASATRSILAQTFGDFEFIIIDDGSTDRSPQILRDLAANDKRIRLISRPNKGLTKSLNEGLSLATASLIARIDADDLSLPTRFEKQAAYLDAHPECVCLGSRVTLIDPYESPINVTDHKLEHDAIDADLLQGIGWAIVHPAAMMRTEAVRNVGGYREQFKTSQDLDLWLRLAEIGKLANLEEPLTQYRQHFESVANTKHEDQWQCKAQIIGDTYDRRGMQRPAEWPFQKRVPLSHADQLKRWAWAALKAGNPTVARKHAMAVMKKAPFSIDSWRVMYCALRGR